MQTTFTPEALTAQINAVCAALGDDVICNVARIGDGGKYTTSYFELAGAEFAPAKLSLTLKMDGTHRLLVDVKWPDTHDGSGVYASQYVRQDEADVLGGYPQAIGMNVTKDPLVIAADIRNRFLPHMLKFLPLVVAGNEAWKNKDAENRQAYSDMLLSMGKTQDFINSYIATHGGRTQSAYPLKFTGYKGPNRVEISISMTGYVHLDLGFPNTNDALHALNSINV